MAQADSPPCFTVVNNIYLVGFMCYGKTLTGRALARLLKRRFCDSDRALEKKHADTIAGLVKKEGMPGFRRMESAMLRKITAGRGLVAALGGGVYPSRLGTSGITVHLHCPWPEL